MKHVEAFSDLELVVQDLFVKAEGHALQLEQSFMEKLIGPILEVLQKGVSLDDHMPISYIAQIKSAVLRRLEEVDPHFDATLFSEEKIKEFDEMITKEL